ncbi:MAG: hypothetical protein ACP6IP_05425 [Candidatus Njordarchaeia archaeon]
MQSVDAIIENLFKELENLTEKRDNMLKRTRLILALCRESINYLHQRKLGESREVIKKLDEEVGSLLNSLRDEPKLVYSGTLRDVLGEYVEVKLLNSFIKKFEEGKEIELPEWRELVVTEESYMLGLFDFLGELNREIIYYMRKKDFKKAWAVFNYIHSIVSKLEKKVFLNAIVPGYKPKVDSLKRMVISTEEFLLKAENESALVEKLEKLISSKLHD